MEEKKKTTAPAGEQKKLTFDELKNVCSQAMHERDFYKQKSEQLLAELQKSNMFNDFKMVDYFFKVLENASHFTPSFVTSCSGRLERFLAEPEESPKSE